MKPQKLARHEIIGLHVQVIKAKNDVLQGIKGKVINETKNTLSIETNKGLKKILKKEVTLLVKTQEGNVKLLGESLIGRPENRIKQKRRLLKRW